MPYTANFHKYFIDEKGIAESLMTTLQAPRILGPEYAVTPQTNRFITYENAAHSQQIFDIPVAKIEPIIDPDGVLNDFGWKSMTFVLIIGRTHYAVVSQRPLICQYPICPWLHEYSGRTDLLQLTSRIVTMLIIGYTSDMHSYVNRRTTQRVLDSLKYYPVVALLGARQVGKSTLAKQICAGFPNAVYLDLESPRDINKLQDPEAFFELNEDSLICLDEIQRMPGLFEVLRVVADKTAQRFLVLGSASRDLIRQSAETLAGRIAYLELTPFTLDEISAVDSKLHWLRGGYPRSVLAKNDDISFEWRLNYIRTFLERDIPQLGFNIPANTLQRLWQMLAHNQGQTLNSAKLGNSLDKSAHTVRHYIDILEQTFLVRTLAPFSVNVRKRLVKSPKVYLRDSGLLHTLLDIETMNNLLGHPVYGSSYEGYVIENILVNLPRWKPSFYRTAGGAELDLVLSRGADIVAIEIKASSAPKPSRGFWSSCEDIKATRKYVIGAVADAYPIKNGVYVCNINELIEALAKV